MEEKEKDEQKDKESETSNKSEGSKASATPTDIKSATTVKSASILKSALYSSKRSIISVTIKKKKPTVLIIEPISSEGEHEIKLLYDKCNVKLLKKYPAEREEILESVPGVDGIIMGSRLHIDEEIIKAAGNQLKVISTASNEVDEADLQIAKKFNLHVATSNNMPTSGLANVSIGLMIGVARSYQKGLLDIRRNTWDTNDTFSNLGKDIRGSTVGFIGFGQYARSLAKRLHGFSVQQYLYADPNDEIGSYNILKSSLSKLLRESDFIFLCCTLTEKTLNIINEAAFNKMKRTSILVNVLKPQLIDFDAMYDALDKKKIYGIGLDTFDPNKLSSLDKFLKLENLMLTPRISFQSSNSSRLFVTIVLNNLLKGLSGKYTNS